MTFDELPESDFPFKKQLIGDRFAYLAPLTFGRFRINVTTLANRLSVDDFY